MIRHICLFLLALWGCLSSVMGQTAIVRQECWIDGNLGSRQAVSSGGGIDLSGLSAGLHSITVRAQDAGGLWSSPVTQYFIIGTAQQAATAISKTEYWLDGDVTGRTVLGASVATVDLSALSTGLHSITVRAQDDAGVWSSPVTQYFIIGTAQQAATAISKTEYWLDGDVTGRTVLGASVATVDLSALSTGLHSITVRAQNDQGVWSSPVTQYFVKMAEEEPDAVVTRCAYWFDDDTEHTFTQAIDSPTGIIEIVDLSTIESGEHTLSWMVGDSHGRWSQPATEEFSVVITGINSLTPAPSPKGEGSGYVYDLQGRKVADSLSSLTANPSSRKGIYVVNGKKVVVR